MGWAGADLGEGLASHLALRKESGGFRFSVLSSASRLADGWCLISERNEPPGARKSAAAKVSSKRKTGRYEGRTVAI